MEKNQQLTEIERNVAQVWVRWMIDKGDKWYFLYSLSWQVGCTATEWAGNAVIHPYRCVYLKIHRYRLTKWVSGSCSWSWRLWPMGVNRLRNAQCECETHVAQCGYLDGIAKQLMLIYGGIFFWAFLKGRQHWLQFVSKWSLKFGIFMLVKFLDFEGIFLVICFTSYWYAFPYAHRVDFIRGLVTRLESVV